jgi:hypothetical protein
MAFYRARLTETKSGRHWYVCIKFGGPNTHLQLQEHDINPFTKQPHSAQYKKILESRKKLPVYAQMDDFYKMVSGVVHTARVRGLRYAASRYRAGRPHPSSAAAAPCLYGLMTEFA